MTRPGGGQNLIHGIGVYRGTSAHRGRLGLRSTHSCPWPISRRTTGLPWHLTFDHAAEMVSDRDSGRSRVATIARQRIPAERLHPKATHWRSRPGADSHERPLSGK